jgi:outer membrane biosynthesis protein TonB
MFSMRGIGGAPTSRWTEGSALIPVLSHRKAMFLQPEQSEQREQSEQPEQSEQREQREQSEQPEQPEQSEQPEQREQREQSEQREQREQLVQSRQFLREASAFSASASDPKYSTLARLLFASTSQVAPFSLVNSV